MVNQIHFPHYLFFDLVYQAYLPLVFSKVIGAGSEPAGTGGDACATGLCGL
jgi:hypothetical protein